MRGLICLPDDKRNHLMGAKWSLSMVNVRLCFMEQVAFPQRLSSVSSSGRTNVTWLPLPHHLPMKITCYSRHSNNNKGSTRIVNVGENSPRGSGLGLSAMLILAWKYNMNRAIMQSTVYCAWKHRKISQFKWLVLQSLWSILAEFIT